MEMTEQEKDRYLDWFFEECYTQADELSWILDNVNDEVIQNIKDTVLSTSQTINRC
jgi:hypothetical protein